MDIKDLYPTLTPVELKEAEANLDRYLETVYEIARARLLEADPKQTN